MAKWADDNAEGLKKFAAVLKKVVEVAKEKRWMELEYVGVGEELRVRKVGGEVEEMSEEVKEQWIGRGFHA